MNSIGKKVPPSTKPRRCNGTCEPKKRAVKGRTQCAQCEFEATQRSNKAAADAAAK
jgi:hypothetical protein